MVVFELSQANSKEQTSQVCSVQPDTKWCHSTLEQSGSAAVPLRWRWERLGSFLNTVAQAPPPESHHCQSFCTTHVMSSDLDWANQSTGHGKFSSNPRLFFVCTHFSNTMTTLKLCLKMLMDLCIFNFEKHWLGYFGSLNAAQCLSSTQRGHLNEVRVREKSFWISTQFRGRPH